MLLKYAARKTPDMAIFIRSGSRGGLVQPKPGATRTHLARIVSLLILMATGANSFGSSENHMSRSNRSPYQKSMTHQEARDELRRRGIEYSAKPFIEDAQNGQTDLISIFLDAGLDPNIRDDSGLTALMAAASGARDRAMGLLLARGASVSLADDEGFTALHRAARAYPGFKCVMTLLDHGADVHAKSKEAGVTPLVWAIPVLPPLSAVQERFVPDAIAKITALLDHGADINARFGGSVTPLMRAAVIGNLKIIRLLIKRGADLNTIDSEGWTARRFALRYHHPEAAKIIEQAGGLTDQSDIQLFVPKHSADAQPSASNDADAGEVMKQVVAAYHSLSSYNDRGTSIVHLAGSDAAYRVDFETLFKRPNKLRFAWTLEYSNAPGKQHKSVIWCDGITAWSSYSFHSNKPERKENLELAVAGAIGASWTTAHTIPRLLSDEVGGIRLDEQLRSFKIIGNDTLDGVGCVVVIGAFTSGGECKVWVGLKDHLIRRIEERSKIGTREEVRTQIVVNQDIPDSRFSDQGR